MSMLSCDVIIQKMSDFLGLTRSPDYPSWLHHRYMSPQNKDVHNVGSVPFGTVVLFKAHEVHSGNEARTDFLESIAKSCKRKKWLRILSSEFILSCSECFCKRTFKHQRSGEVKAPENIRMCSVVEFSTASDKLQNKAFVTSLRYLIILFYKLQGIAIRGAF